MACRTGCPTQDHANWGECARQSNMRIAYCASAKGLDLTAQKQWDKELDDYGAARKQGIQPRSTKTGDIRAALEVSDVTGSAFDAGARLVGV